MTSSVPFAECFGRRHPTSSTWPSLHVESNAVRLVVSTVILLLGACAGGRGSGSAGATRIASAAKNGADTTGLWRVPRDQRSHGVSAGVVAIAFQHHFYFDGDSVVVSLATLKEWMWRTPDDTYRLRARWQGADLQYLPPFGDWTTLATFRDGRFEQAADGGPFIFERVADRDFEDEDRLLLEPREKHDYRRRTDGTLESSN